MLYNQHTNKMSEQALANKMRIELLEYVSQKDLPWFLYEQIDNHLGELNYFKIANLLNNVDPYLDYLEELSDTYTKHIRENNPDTPCNSLTKDAYEPFMTNTFYNEDYQLNFTPSQLIKISSLYGVSCLLTMKEYVHRRILQKSTSKAFAK